MFRKTKVCRGLMLAFGGSLALGALPVQAQQQLERVEITGSAIKRIDAETAVPVTVIKADDLRKQGVTSIEQIMSSVSAVQMTQGTSQSVGAGTGGASFADLRGIGANKTLVLLNGRRIANNALDSSAPDLNMIPIAALDRIEVLRDGASSLYGTDAIGGVINFITRKDYTGVTLTAGYKMPQDDGGETKNFNIGVGFGDLEKSGFNVFGFIDYEKQNEITGTERSWNTREPGGLSPTTFPANYFQAGNSYNPTAPGCAAPNLIPDATGTGCQIATAAFVNYIPQSERTSGMLKGTVKLGDNHRLGLEFFGSHSEVISKIAPVPYGGLRMNPTRPDGTPNPYYDAVVRPNPNIDPGYVPTTGLPTGAQAGFVNVRWRDLVHGQRTNIDTNDQMRFIASLEGTIGSWDYQTALSYNENKYENGLAGYSDGPTITAGVRDGVINPFGPQDAAGTALLAGAGREGVLQTAKGTVTGLDVRTSTELGDWLGAGRPAALALGGEYRKEKFINKGNVDFATLVVASTGFDPNTLSEGNRDVYAGYAELNVPILKSLEITGAVRYDDYSDFGSTTNPKVSFRYQPIDQFLVRGSYSTGFRAPSLYELNAAQTYTNTGQFDDPINCPGGVPIAGKPAAQNCNVQFQSLFGGNTNLQPEKSKSTTLGLVFAPVKDASIAFDFWWLKVKQQINNIADGTVLGDPVTYGYLYNRNPNGDLSTDGSSCPGPDCGYIDVRTSNLGGLNTNGVDLTANWRLNAGDAGNFGFMFNGTYVTKYEYQEAGENSAWQQNVGRWSGVAPIFRVQYNIGASWNGGPFGIGFVAHHKSGYLDQNPDGQSDKVVPYTTYDVNTSWTPLKGLLLTFGIINFMDQDPPFSNQVQVFQAGYDPRFSDPTGRTYYLRGTYSF